jgi:hypothetical protein
MYRLIVPLAVIALLAVIFGCADDIILEEEPPIEGVYKGEYTFVGDADNDGSLDTLAQMIDWVFEDDEYRMFVDTSVDYNDNWPTCQVSGDYLLTEGVRLRQITSIPDERAGFDACKESENPSGVFVLIRKSGGYIDLRQQNADTLKFLALRPLGRLEDHYFGDYTIATGIGSADTVEQTQQILFKFTLDQYFMKVDTTKLFNTEWSTCLVEGDYTVSGNTANLTLVSSEVDTDAGFTTCLSETSPEGSYSITEGRILDTRISPDSLDTVTLRRTAADSLILLELIRRP